MSRPIDADALIPDHFIPSSMSNTPCQLYVSMEQIHNAPTIEPEQRTGDWVEIRVIKDVYDIRGVKTWASELQCDQCGFIRTAIEGHNAQYIYCPSCGAKLKGKKMNICIAVADNCQNFEESYGEICVRCNKCGRFCEDKDYYTEDDKEEAEE